MKRDPATDTSIRVVLDSPVPVYRQVLDGVRMHCVAGRLKPGDKLPTVRHLAASLGIHFNTVAEAYRLLADEGWISLERRRGATVLDRQQPRTPGATAATQAGDRLRNLIAELEARGFGKDWIRREIHAALDTN